MFDVSEQWAGLAAPLSVWLPRLLLAIALLAATYLLARVVRWGLVKLVDNVARTMTGGQPGGDLASSVGLLGYWIVWLVGLLAALQPLGLSQALSPVHALTREVLTYLPRLVGAGLVFFVGLLVARIVRTIVETALAAVPWQRLCARLSGQAPGAPDAASATAGQCGALVRAGGALAFTVVIIPVAISALEIVGIASLVDPMVLVLRTVLEALPRLVAAALLLALAYVVARWVRGLVEQVLASTGFDRALGALGNTQASVQPSRVAGWLVLVAIMLFASIEAARLLGFDVVGTMLAQATELGGHVVFGSVIVLAGVVMARLVARLVGDAIGESGLPSVLKYAIIALAVAMGLRFMGLANEIVNLAFGLILGSAAVACALAFGLGGRQTAHELLQRWTRRTHAGSDEPGAASTERAPD